MDAKASEILQFIKPSGFIYALGVLGLTWLLGRLLTPLTDRLAKRSVKGVSNRPSSQVRPKTPNA